MLCLEKREEECGERRIKRRRCVQDKENCVRAPFWRKYLSAHRFLGRRCRSLRVIGETVRFAVYVDRSHAAEQERRQHVGRLKAELTRVNGSLDRLLELVEKGGMDMDDPALVERLRRHKADRARLTGDIALADTPQSPRHQPLTSTKLRRLSDAMRQGLREGSIDLRRAYVRMFVNRIVVSRREVRITGPRAALARAASDTGELPHPGSPVLTFVRKWRPVGDSNPCYRRERAVSWASRRTGHRLSRPRAFSPSRTAGSSGGQAVRPGFIPAE